MFYIYPTLKGDYKIHGKSLSWKSLCYGREALLKSHSLNSIRKAVREANNMLKN